MKKTIETGHPLPDDLRTQFKETIKKSDLPFVAILADSTLSTSTIRELIHDSSKDVLPQHLPLVEAMIKYSLNKAVKIKSGAEVQVRTFRKYQMSA